jgi:hypothetical protein
MPDRRKSWGRTRLLKELALRERTIALLQSELDQRTAESNQCPQDYVTAGEFAQFAKHVDANNELLAANQRELEERIGAKDQRSLFQRIFGE